MPNARIDLSGLGSTYQEVHFHAGKFYAWKRLLVDLRAAMGSPCSKGNVYTWTNNEHELELGKHMVNEFRNLADKASYWCRVIRAREFLLQWEEVLAQ